jgi:murein DD-endopeptidase MepM/ murein hydrolase activator NlpD
MFLFRAFTCLIGLVVLAACDSAQTAHRSKAKPKIDRKAPEPPLALWPPTENHFLFKKDAEGKFYMSTGPERPWSSGAYGCVRNSGGRMHEGVDIRCLRRDDKGEPRDEVSAVARGRVAFANRKPGASSYGQYVVVMHETEGLSFYTLYAHLGEVEADVQPGLEVKAGHVLGVMGRTANHEIPKNRAHLHFEIGFVGSRNFDTWMRRHYKDPDFNKFGNWHGFNLLGLDPVPILLNQRKLGNEFSLAKHIASQPELMRIRIRGGKLPLAERLPGLVLRATAAETLPVVGHELALSLNGTPLRIRPLTKWPGGKSRFELVGVNDVVASKNRCRKLVFKKGAKWVLTNNGHRLADLLATGAVDDLN